MKILKEVALSDPLYPSRLKGMDKFRPPPEDAFVSSDEDNGEDKEQASEGQDEEDPDQPSTSDGRGAPRRKWGFHFLA